MIVIVRLNLPKIVNKVILHYNTFEKVSYDRYLMASIISNSKNEDSIYSVIDTITGNGSLNEHFEKLYLEMSLLSKKEIESILSDSLYPIQKIDTITYDYISLLNVSLFNKSIHLGDLKNDSFFPKYLVPETGTYIKHETADGMNISKPNSYKVKIDDNGISILINNEYIKTSESALTSIIEKEDLNITTYKGSVRSNFVGDDWYQLTNLKWNSLKEHKDYFYHGGDYFSIENEYVNKTEIAFVLGIYWYKQTQYRYTKDTNIEILEMVAKTLIETGRINEFKTKSLLEIMKNLKREDQKMMVNYVLTNKDSKELALLGLLLIDKGFEKGWSDSAFTSLYKHRETDKHLISLYRVNSTYNYPIEEMVSIDKLDKNILSEQHKSLVSDYYNDYTKIEKTINQKIGEIVSSGIRERIGKNPLDDDSKQLRKFINDKIAHTDSNIKNKTLNQLKQYETTIDNMYKLYTKVKIRLDNLSNTQ